MKVTFQLTGLLLVFLLSSCSEKKTQSEIDEEIIIKYINDNNLNMTRHTSGIYYNISNQGYGGHPSSSSVVKVQYKGYLTDGSVFDEATTPVEFPLHNLILGWRIGIPMLQKSGKGKFIIPSGYGYGSSAKSGIPANSVLIFDITLIDF